MSFSDMPPLGPLMLPGAAEYATSALDRSRLAVANTRNEFDVPYGGDFYQKLDIFLPDRATRGLVPVLMFLHGGAWKNGFKEWLGFMAPPLLELPAIFVSVNYRLVPHSKYPAAVDDCLAALKWVHDNIRGRGGDPQRIFLGGHSAGGHIATLTTLRRDKHRALGLPPDIVRACLPLSASLSLARSEAEPGGRREALLQLILAPEDDGRDGTAFSHVAGNRTPFLIVYGSRDLPELLEQNRRFAKSLIDQPGAVTRIVLDEHDHFSTNLACGDPAGAWVRQVRHWMAG